MGSSTLTIQQALSLYVVSELDLLDDVAAKKVHVEVVSHVSGDVLMLSQADCAELYFLRDLPITASAKYKKLWDRLSLAFGGGIIAAFATKLVDEVTESFADIDQELHTSTELPNSELTDQSNHATGNTQVLYGQDGEVRIIRRRIPKSLHSEIVNLAKTKNSTTSGIVLFLTRRALAAPEGKLWPTKGPMEMFVQTQIPVALQTRMKEYQNIHGIVRETEFLYHAMRRGLYIAGAAPL